MSEQLPNQSDLPICPGCDTCDFLVPLQSERFGNAEDKVLLTAFCGGCTLESLSLCPVEMVDALEVKAEEDELRLASSEADLINTGRQQFNAIVNQEFSLTQES